MSVRRSVRLNPNYNPNITPKQETSTTPNSVEQENQKQVKQEQVSPKEKCLNSAEIQVVTIEHENPKNEKDCETKAETDVEMIDEKPPKVTSAVVKALNKIEFNAAEKKKGKKNARIPVALKRKKLNKKLSRLLAPKSALILLHELKPNCTYKVQEQPGCIPPSFCAQVLHNDEVLGTGQGLSKSHAKNSAAENAIRMIVSKTMSNQPATTENENNSVEIADVEMEDTPENLPWAGLASFALYKMFSDWQAQGSDLLTRPVSKPKTKPQCIQNAPTKKELPQNANELHPAVVLNMVCPGLTAVEVERENGPKCRVKMGYSVDGKMYTGVGGNKKDAKKEAAKAVLEGLYGLTYSQ